MMIEQSTNYAYKLKHMANPTFDKVRNLSTKFYRELPQALQDELYEALNRGIDILDSEPQMTAYLYSFGNMHQAKLNKAFENIPPIFFEQPAIQIIDYGCGQAIGTMCYADFLGSHGYTQKINKVTLIEPSEICLQRATLHVSKFCPDAEIVTVNKEFDYLADEDIARDEDTPTLHIFSNVLDLDFDLGNFAQVISDNINGYNQFVCVGPYFNKPSVDHLMDDFAGFFEGKDSFNKIFDKYQLNPEKSWTAHIRCFSVGEMAEELSTEVTDEEIENGIEDEYGVVYSKDGKRLLECRNSELREYTIKNGTRVICGWAFSSCQSLQQITIPDSVTSIGSNPFGGYLKPTLKSKSSRFIVTEEGLLIDIQLDNIISYVGKAQYVTIPDSVTSIGNWAFSCCDSLQQITIPDSVTSIGVGAFSDCESLRQIIIPKGSADRFTKMLPEVYWGKFCYLIRVFPELRDDSYENGLDFI